MVQLDSECSDRIVNIVTLYSNENEVIEYAQSLSSQSIAQNVILVIVVNKKSEKHDETFIKNIKNINLETYIYYPINNLGYLNGLIYGYNQYIKEHDPAKWIVMSNTDINFSTNRFFEDFLINKYEDDIWMIGPSVFSSENKSYDNPQYCNRHTLQSINKRIYIFTRPKLAYCYLKLANLKAKLKKQLKLDSQFSYSVHGCFFFINSNFMELLKNKRYTPLMYSEEAYLAELVRLNNKKCYYNSEIEVIHKGSTVTGKIEIERKSGYFLESLEYIKKEFYSKEFGE